MLVTTKFANVINIAANEEVIPELLQSNCNPKNILKVVSKYLDNPNMINEQVSKTQLILSKFKNNNAASSLAAHALNKKL